MVRLSAVVILLGALLLADCGKQGEQLFQSLSPRKTGIRFKNTLAESPEFNVMLYSYFYNGGGVAVGDVDNDGLPDIYFTGNLVASHLYINKGNWKYENVAAQAGVEAAGLWNTGVVMADVNQDGWLDIYVCRSAAQDPNARRNLLFINQGLSADGQVTFVEQAAHYGLDDPAYSTHAAFFDYDRDGDLDLFLLNHSVPEYSGFDSQLGQLKSISNPYFSDKLYRNDGGKFVDVSAESGLLNNVIGFGLGVAIADFDNDGWPDIYVSNDFNEEDYLYINQGDGTFRESLRACMDYTSLFSMGSDAADFTNNGWVDVVTLDMLPQDNYRIKLTSGADNFDKYQLLLRQGFHRQTMRNMFHINQGNGTFAEIGQLAGIAQSDWSWSALAADFDLDGWQDLFISNGYLRDYTNMDFLAYAADLKVRESGRSEFSEHIEDLLKQMPRIDVANKMYRNRNGKSFDDVSERWGFTLPELSSGAVYADLDNDGDLDLVINNVNEFAGIYRNYAVERGLGHYLKVYLTSDRQCLGARVYLYTGALQMMRELYPSRGYQSSVEPLVHFGLGNQTEIDSLVIAWPDGQHEVYLTAGVDTTLFIRQGTGIDRARSVVPAEPIFSAEQMVEHWHVENDYNDFNVQRLLPEFQSRLGPSLRVADVNGDGLHDLVVGAAEGFPTAVFLQMADGRFIRSPQPVLDRDRIYEDTDLLLADLDADGWPDLLVASGGNRHPAGDHRYTLRCYRNRRGVFEPWERFPVLQSNSTCLAAGDLTGNGYLDIFLGSAYKVHEYPLADDNFVLLQVEPGSFILAGDLPFINSRTTGAIIADIDADGAHELITAGPWTQVKAWVYRDGGWLLKYQSERKGWYHSLHAAQLDDDKHLELVAGNLGNNSPLRATAQEPLIVYYGDFDGNGTIDPVLSYFVEGKSYPYVSRDDLISQIPGLKKHFTSYHDYALMSMPQLLMHLPGARSDTIHTTETVVLNLVDGVLKEVALPIQAQYAPVYAIADIDYNDDGLQDLILAGNNAFVRVKTGEMSANHGLLLRNMGGLIFDAVPQWQSGFSVRADVRGLAVLQGTRAQLAFFGVNDGALAGYRLLLPSAAMQKSETL